MIHDQIEFHNVAELVAVPGVNGLAMHRYPRNVIDALTPLGHHMAAASSGVELRFVSGTSWLSLTLSARSNTSFSVGADVEIFRGDIPVASATIPDGATRTLTLTAPALPKVRPEVLEPCRYSPDVWRIHTTRATVFYHGLDTAGQPCRPPRADEVPAQRWLAYGSSITNATPGYVMHAARHLGVDPINKGLSGACWCEPEVADYLASSADWDFATLELGINMLGAFDKDSFAERACHMVNAFRSAAPEKKLVLITMFPTGNDYVLEPNGGTKKNREFRDVIRSIAAEHNDPMLYLIEGDQILTDISKLSPDLVHPSPNGYQDMGTNLAALLRPIIQEAS